MKKIHFITFLLLQMLFFQQILAQEISEPKENNATLEQKKEEIILEEKEALKKEVIAINEQFNNGDINADEAEKLKEEAAEIHALNIENKIAILENSVALSERGGIYKDTIDTNIETDKSNTRLKIQVFDEEDSMIEITTGKQKKYDKRTRSNLLVAFGLNNAIIEGGSLNDSPYKIGKSRFFEIGWTWSTRVLNNSNAIRFRYGFAFQFNGLSPTDNRYFVQDGKLTYLETFPVQLTKAKLRMDNIVFPVHLEFGPSKKIDKGNYFRYSSRKKFKFGIGAYYGFNMRTRQKLKYNIDGSRQKEKITKSYNTSNIIYGISTYIGLGDFSFCLEYDLNKIFNEPNLQQNNISLGLRFDL